MNDAPRIPTKEFSAAELRRFFISHLNRIYCAKSQLVDKLPQLGERSHFLDLRQAISETIEVVELQIERMKEVYIALDTFYQQESCVGLIGILDEAFQSIGSPADTAAIRDLSILFYMQNIESIETASFKVMKTIRY
jgi:ferritin-like metal-binding protein YciE